MTEPKGAKARYKTTNWAAYNAALKARTTLIEPDPATFYGGDEKGYTDYPAFAPAS
jgi:hypothetical protein